MQCLDNGRRIVGSHLQQRERGTVGHPAPLFPISECRHAHTDHERELRLRLAKIGAHRFHIRRLKRARTGRLALAAADFTKLAYAGQQLFEGFGFHVNSSRTTRANARICVGDKSPCSFFAYMYTM